MPGLCGVLGTGSGSKKVIEAALNDIGNKETFVVPWYGNAVGEGLEVVYDWLVDNDAFFTLVAAKNGKPIPKILRGTDNGVVMDTEDVVDHIIQQLAKGKGKALLLWDSTDEDTENASMSLAARCINAGLVTLELNNGLVPIEFETDAPVSAPEPTIGDEDEFEVEVEAPAPAPEPVVASESEEETSTEYSREELEEMPAAAVKRYAQGQGLSAKTKQEAIDALFPEPWDSEMAPTEPFVHASPILGMSDEEAGKAVKELLTKVSAAYENYQASQTEYFNRRVELQDLLGRSTYG